MTIESTSIGIIVVVIVTIVYVKCWRMIAEYIGNRLGIGKFIVALFSKFKKDE